MPNRFTKLAFIALITIYLGACATPPPPKDAAPIPFPKPPDQARFYYERTIMSTGSVQRMTNNERLKSLLTGAVGRDGIAFAKPFDVVVHQGRVFVSDTVQRVVFALDFVSGEAFQIGDRGDEGDLEKPLGLAVDRQGNLYVCDNQSNKVNVYTRDGAWRYSIELKNHMSRPSGIDVSEDGARVYIVDVGGVDSDKHRISIFDTASRAHIRTIGMRGTQLGEFNLPRDVAVSSDGLLYVTDGGNFRVQIFDRDGNPIRSWGAPGRHLGEFTRPKGIAAGPDGNLYVVDAAFGNFQIFNPQGELLLYIGSRSELPGPARFMLPSGIDVDEDGRVYMLDQFFRKLDVFRPASLAENEGYLGAAADRR